MPDPISWEFAWPFYLTAAAFGYLLGSIPFGLLVTRLAGLGDVRKIGSGNIGATNVLRTGRKSLAVATLLGDGGKGALAFLIAYRWGVDTGVIAGFFAFMGHLFPVWLKFSGGKGVATYIGVLLAAYWPMGLGFLATWIAMAVVFRYSSLSALTASLATPLILAYLHQWQFAELFAIMSVFLWVKHHENIRRLLTGKEGRIGQKS